LKLFGLNPPCINLLAPWRWLRQNPEKDAADTREFLVADAPHGGRSRSTHEASAKAIYFSALTFLTSTASGRFAALRSVHEGFGPFSGGRVAAAWRPRWRSRGCRVAAMLASPALACHFAALRSPRMLSTLNFFSCSTTKPFVGIVIQPKTEQKRDEQTNTLKANGLVLLPEVGNPGFSGLCLSSSGFRVRIEVGVILFLMAQNRLTVRGE